MDQLDFHTLLVERSVGIGIATLENCSAISTKNEHVSRDPAIPFLSRTEEKSICPPKNLQECLKQHYSYNSLKLETTQMPFNNRMDFKKYGIFA